jgi:hypothetical protein
MMQRVSRRHDVLQGWVRDASESLDVDNPMKTRHKKETDSIHQEVWHPEMTIQLPNGEFGLGQIPLRRSCPPYPDQVRGREIGNKHTHIMFTKEAYNVGN